MRTTSFWKIATPAICGTVICGAAILWYVYKEKTIQRKLAEEARVSRVSAEQGDPKAQCDLASMYYQGKGVQQDYAEAVGWWRKATDQGDPKAQYALGLMYHNGQGVPQDYAEAVGWYRKAADQGDGEAQYALGFMYRNGQAVPQDDAEAVRWFRKAADHGDAQAQRALASRRRVAVLRWVIIFVFFLSALLLVAVRPRRWGRETWVPWVLASLLCFATNELYFGSSTARILAERFLGTRHRVFFEWVLVIGFLGGGSVICGLCAIVELARGSKRGGDRGQPPTPP